MTPEEREWALEFGNRLVSDYDSDFQKFVRLSISALEQMPITTTNNDGIVVVQYPQVPGITPVILSEK